MKRALLMVFATLAAPAFAREEGYSGSIGVQAGNHTIGIRYEAGLSTASGDRSGARIPILGLELLQAIHTGQHDVRFHLLGIGYDLHLVENWKAQIAVTPFGSLGGISGPGSGGEIFLGLRYKELSVGAYYWSLSGRQNPWDGKNESSELGISLRAMF